MKIESLENPGADHAQAIKEKILAEAASKSLHLQRIASGKSQSYDRFSVRLFAAYL
jgi:hypothetical protein